MNNLDNPTIENRSTLFDQNSIFRGRNTVFDQTSFWLIIGVIVIFIAGTIFGRMTESGTSATNASSAHAVHHKVYGRFGAPHWAH